MSVSLPPTTKYAYKMVNRRRHYKYAISSTCKDIFSTLTHHPSKYHPLAWWITISRGWKAAALPTMTMEESYYEKVVVYLKKILLLVCCGNSSRVARCIKEMPYPATHPFNSMVLLIVVLPRNVFNPAHTYREDNVVDLKSSAFYSGGSGAAGQQQHRGCGFIWNTCGCSTTLDYMRHSRVAMVLQMIWRMPEMNAGRFSTMHTNVQSSFGKVLSLRWLMFERRDTS